MLIDSHCHLNYLDDPQQALTAARQAGVAACLCIGVEEKTIDQVLRLAEANPGVWCSVGEHPGSCSGDAGWVADHLLADKVVAVGEMGLDYYYESDPDQRPSQRATFSQQMDIARQHQLPVIVHTRDAEEDTLAVLRAFPQVRGVLHCFTESWSMAEQAIELGYFISISGIVTFKNADNVRQVASRVPLERLLIETDAPWLAPVPHRGQQNQPAFVADTAAFLSEHLGLEQNKLMAHTADNFYQLFSRAAPDQVL